MNDKPVILITEPEVIEKENETIYDYDKSHVIYKMQDLGSFAELQKMKKQNQKYKEVIDKAKEFVKDHIFQVDGDKDFEELLEILNNKGSNNE